LSEDDDRRAEERVGSVLNDKWTLERLLGIGGMAAVYAARHRNGARAAVKLMHPALSRHPEVRERFRREGYAANRVDHPNVVKVLDDDVVAAGPDTGTAYLVMELLEGHSLQDRLEDGPPLAERDFLAIAGEVLEVLAVAHARGVVHRDLKPENLFLLRDSIGDGAPGPFRVKVLDFGLARLLDGQAITTYGLALGTPSFMSPEQAAGRLDEIDGRTDLFSLAATGFRLRSGRRIHEGANAVELVRKMATMAAPRLKTVAPEASASYARVIDRALEFRREDRYENAAAMLEDTRRAISELDGNARTQLAVNPAPPAAPPDTTTELTGGDLDTVESLIPTRKLEDKQASDEPVRIPKRRRLLPAVVLLVASCAAGKWWFDHRTVAQRAAPSPAPAADDSAAPSASEAMRSVATHDAPQASAAASAPPRATPTTTSSAPVHPTPATVSPQVAPAAAGPASSPHHTTPPKTGPGNVHKLQPGHHARRSRTTPQ
jgi:serine/threonine-protein kinase